MGHEHKQPEHRPGQKVTYLPTGKKVTVFGRERETPDRDSLVAYYWVFDGVKRFKAYPEELSK